ncbi:RNA polymerase sigma factor [Nocardioides sp. MAHUQ-72]|uniref:RNA polymerase sigma factor n=1 Tax=unclassified Nocardioides TaxID=2615069 RepID=UPI00361C878B
MASTRVTDFTSFYEATFGRTVACAFAVLGDLREAEDAAQDGYVAAWRRWRSISGYDDPAAWVRHVTVNRAISTLRRRQTARSFLRSAPPPRDADPPDLTTLSLVAALRTLSEETRRAIVLHHIGDLPVAEIARMEQAPLGTVKARLARGREALVPLLSEAPTPEEARHA